ncbi:MAG: DciA family protein [Propionibacteriaceae bacterium]|nr:DciA family protein [Propionibacteriaceae bacterium]
MSDPTTPDADAPDPVEPAAQGASEEIPFDPTGLDLARQIAAAAGRATPPVRKPSPRKKTGPRRPASGQERGEPTALGEALESVIENRGWGRQVSVHLLLGRWPDLVGDAVAQHSTPEAYVDRVVVVRTTSTNWAAQLRLMAPQIVAKMNASLGDGSVKAVRILGPEAPSWRHGPRTVKGRGPRDTYG